MNRTFKSFAATSLGLLAVFGVIQLARSQSPELASCQSNLKQMALAVLMYTQDYDERYPPTTSAAAVQNRINPYTRNRSVFSCPTSGKPYLPNPALNYVMIGSIKAPATTMMLRDAVPHKLDTGGNGWNVAYADGHVKLSNKEIPLGKAAPSPAAPARTRRTRHKK